MLIRLILLSMLAAIGYFAFVRRHSFPIHVVIIFLLLAMISVLVVFPDLTSRIAALVGVGRGVDLVTYFVEVGVLFVVLKYYTKFVEIESKIVTLTREIALLRAALEADAQKELPRP